MRPIDGCVRPGFTPNSDSRHLIAVRYLVTIVNLQAPVFGSTEVGGQEASGIVWFTEKGMPPDEQFGYGHDQTYRACFSIARKLLP